MSDKKTTVQLPRSDTVRASQLIHQYGAGAIVNLRTHTLMTAAPSDWRVTSKIHDVRLEKRLHVDYFLMPNVAADGKEKGDFVAYVRFPAWHYCPKCQPEQKMEAK